MMDLLYLLIHGSSTSYLRLCIFVFKDRRFKRHDARDGTDDRQQRRRRRHRRQRRLYSRTLQRESTESTYFFQIKIAVVS